MTFTKLKQATVALMAVGILTACGSNTDKIIETITNQVQTDEAAVTQLQETVTKQSAFMDSFDELLKNAAKKYEKVEEALEGMKTEAASLKTAFETAQTTLDLSADEESKLEKLLSKSEKEENYEAMNELVNAYQTYKTDLETLSTDNVSLMSEYETFLNEISAEMEFQTLENLIGKLNQSLEKVQASYEAYTKSATQFQTLLMKTQN